MFDEQITSNDLVQTENSNEQSISAFTFYVSDTLFALRSDEVLSVNDDLDKIKKMPVDGQGILGVYNYQNVMVPVFDYAELIGVESGQQVMQSLVKNLETRETEHVEWLNALYQSIDEGVPFTKALDPNQCAFGKWYNEFKTRDVTLQEILTHFDAPHKHIHSLAEKLLSLRDQGKKDEALDHLRIEKQTTLRRLQALFKQSREQVASAMRPVIIFVTEDGLAPKFGIVIDEVNNIIEYAANSVQSDIGISSLSGNANLFSGIYVGDDGVDSIICNIDGIVTQ